MLKFKEPIDYYVKISALKPYNENTRLAGILNLNIKAYDLNIFSASFRFSSKKKPSRWQGAIFTTIVLKAGKPLK